MLREFKELVSVHSGWTQRFAEHDVQSVFNKTVRDLNQYGFSSMEDKRVLDLGCGQRFPFALQCAAAGARVTALDLNYMKPDSFPSYFIHTAQHNGLKRAAKSSLRRLMWDSRYYEVLEENAGKPLRSYAPRIEFVVSDPTSTVYQLPSGAFDLIASNAVLEHVADVPAFAAEVARLLDSGGLFYGIIHNYFSLSGGHNMDWAYADEAPPDDVPPWDHLREQRYPNWVYLNKLKPEEFQAAFGYHLDLLCFDGVGIHHELNEPEGERFLTPEIEAELSQYPRELLLTRAWRIIARKR